jgi:hypothetical protein
MRNLFLPVMLRHGRQAAGPRRRRNPQKSSCYLAAIGFIGSAKSGRAARQLPPSGEEDETKAEANGTKIYLQVGSELRITRDGSIVMDNPELELVGEEQAADATLLYRYDGSTGMHIIRLLHPVADRQHLKEHRRND